MSRTGDNLDNMYPRLSIAWIAADERGPLVSALGRHGLVVTGAVLEEAAAAVAAQRRDTEVDELAVVDRELRALDARYSSAEMALADLVAEQKRLRDAADWCELQQERDANSGAQIEAFQAQIVEQSRVARESTRRLERVLEQRAAAEAALEEARRELTGLGATGIDETDVRRQMETASHDLRSASSAYQEAMTDVARRQAELADLEDALARAEAEPSVPRISEGNQFQAMGRALQAKFAPEVDASTSVSHHDVERAREEVRLAQERADAAASQLSTSRRRINTFESELTARIDDGDARGARHDAALALEAQVSSVELQLSEAEAAARAQVDEATRTMSRIELALERERQDVRDRRRRLGELVALMPAADRPPAEDDVVAHAGTIAAALRALVEPMQDDVDAARTASQTLRSEHDVLTAEVGHRRARLGVVDHEDRSSALQVLAGDGQGVVVLDDVVGAAHDQKLSVSAFEALETERPLIVLTTDPDVAAWAIELPADVGRIVHVAELWSLVEVDLISSQAPSAADQHPAPSPSR